MKNSFALKTLDPEMEVIAAYDHADIDNPDLLAFSRLSYLDRISFLISSVRRLFPSGGAVTESAARREMSVCCWQKLATARRR